jgi:hypothetical protein
MRHRRGRRCAVPVLLTGLEPNLKPSEGLMLPDLFTMSDTNFRDHPFYELR